MCTVTYIPNGNKTFITSNRDEKYSRSPALAPESYEFRGANIFYPKDTKAGGTWFAVHENGNVVVLMNGAFVLHYHNPPYRHSRGLVVLKLIQHESPNSEFKNMDLHNIEPFTVIIWEDEQLTECRWDGEKKHLLKLESSLAYIWSSATLYDDEIASKRQLWFNDWLQQNTNPTQEDVLNFHRFTGDGDEASDLLMNIGGIVHTVSVTGVVLNETRACIKYFDTSNSKFSDLEIELKKECARR